MLQLCIICANLQIPEIYAIYAVSSLLMTSELLCPDQVHSSQPQYHGDGHGSQLAVSVSCNKSGYPPRPESKAQARPTHITLHSASQARPGLSR